MSTVHAFSLVLASRAAGDVMQRARKSPSRRSFKSRGQRLGSSTPRPRPQTLSSFRPQTHCPSQSKYYCQHSKPVQVLMLARRLQLLQSFTQYCTAAFAKRVLNLSDIQSLRYSSEPHYMSVHFSIHPQGS